MPLAGREEKARLESGQALPRDEIGHVTAGVVRKIRLQLVSNRFRPAPAWQPTALE